MCSYTQITCCCYLCRQNWFCLILWFPPDRLCKKLWPTKIRPLFPLNHALMIRNNDHVYIIRFIIHNSSSTLMKSTSVRTEIINVDPSLPAIEMINYCCNSVLSGAAILIFFFPTQSHHMTVFKVKHAVHRGLVRFQEHTISTICSLSLAFTGWYWLSPDYFLMFAYSLGS